MWYNIKHYKIHILYVYDMWKLIKQCFNTYFKKYWFLITMGVSYFVIIFIAATSMSIMSSISTSINDANNQGHSAQMAITGLDNIKNTKLIPDFDVKTNSPYVPKKVPTATLNLNGINVDDWSKLTTFEEKYNFLRIFPYKRSELISHYNKKKYQNSKNNEVYKNIPGPLMTYVGNPLLEIPLSLVNGKYGFSISFFDPYQSKLLVDPRNILLSYDSINNTFTTLGLWNNGVINNKITLNSSFTAFINTKASGDNIFNNEQFSKLAMNRTNNDVMITDSYITNNKKYVLNDVKVESVVNVGDKNNDLIMHKTNRDSYIDDYLKMIPFDKKPVDENTPYIDVTDGFEFSFVLANDADTTDYKFREYLIKNDPNNTLLKPIVLDEFNLLGMTISEYNKLTTSEKNEVNTNSISSIRQYANLLTNEWNKQKKEWIINTMTINLRREGINSSSEYEYYYQSFEAKHEYLYVPKTEIEINNLIIDNGRNLPYEYTSNAIKDLNLSHNKKLSKDDLIHFLTFLTSFTVNNAQKKQKFIDLTNQCIIDLQASDSIASFNKNSSNWTEWMFRYGNGFSQNDKDVFDYSFSICNDAGFTSLYFKINLYKTNIANHFIVLSNSYYYENKKKCIPTQGYEMVSGSDGKEIPLYSFDSIINGDYDSSYLNIENFDKYIQLIPGEYKISYFNKEFLIIGSGISPDYNFPIVNIQSPIPDPKYQAIVYTTQNLYKCIIQYNNTVDSVLYISLSSKTHSDNEIKNISSQIMHNNFGNDKLLSVVSPDKINGISSLRYSLPRLIQSIIIIGAIGISLILFVILLYVSYMILNIVIEQLNNVISICRAEGFSKWKIALCVGLPLVIIVGTICALSYLLTFLLTPIFLNSLSSIWFLPLVNMPFDWYILLGCIGIPIGFILLVVTTLIFIKFRKPILDNMNDVESVNNKSLPLLRNIGNNSLTIWKYRINLFFSKFSKLIVLILLTAITFGLGIASFTITENSNNSISLMNNSQKYTFALDLISPQENIGLYKEVPYADVGITNEDKGINISNIYFSQNDPYGKMIDKQYEVYINENSNKTEWVTEAELNGRLAINVKATPSDLFALRDSDGNIIDYNQNTPEIDKKYFTNYIMPSYNTFTLVSGNYYSNMLYDSILSIFLIDLDLDLGALNLGNIWQNYVKPFLPQKIAYQIESNVREFKKLIYETFPIEFSKFIYKGVNFDPNNIIINSKKVIVNDLSDSFTKIRFNDEYLKFLGMVFANPLLASKDVKLISGATIPVNTYYDYKLNNLSGYDETYTWTISNNFIQNNTKVNEEIKIIGIKPDSTFINLYDNNGNLINVGHLGINEIVINNGAALKYGLNVGDQITIYPTNDYYESSWKIANTLSEIERKNVGIKLKVKYISNDPIGEQFYSSQENVNKWINLDEGRIITSIKMNHYENNFQNYIKYENLETYKTKNPNYVPFNGIFTNTANPLVGDKAILLTSTFGLYSCFFTFNSLPDITSTYVDPEVFANLYASNNIDILRSLNLASYNDMVNLIKNNFINSNSIIEWLSKEYDDIVMLVNIGEVSSLAITNQLFSITNQLINNTNILLLCIFIPILISTIIVSIIGIIDLCKKQIGILRLLGYTSAKITRTILYLFLPSIILSGLLGAGIVILILYISQKLLYDLTSIFVATSPNFLIIIFGIGLLLLLLIFITLVCYVLLKKLKYSQLIKNTYN